MAQILTYPNPVLRQKAEPVTKFDAELRQLINELKTTLQPTIKDTIGVGLAANQIGVTKRVFLATFPGNQIEVVVNPEIIKTYPKTMSSLPEDQQFFEGCLSIPGYYGLVDRPIKIRVRYQTVTGLVKERVLVKPNSSYFQHELDHINGILFIDHLKKSKGQLYLADKKTGKLKLVKNPF